MPDELDRLKVENETLRREVERARSAEGVGVQIEADSERLAARLHDAEARAAALAAENARFCECGHRLEYALDRIDSLLLSPERVKKDIEAVGGPVSPYTVDYDEEGVVKRTGERLAALETRLAECAEHQDLAPHEGCQCRLCTCMRKVAALEAVVARLPKTADGVPIAGDMVVWLCEEGAINPRIVWGTKWSGLCGTHILFEHESRLPGECYSTREAAEAAKEVKP